jgi:putative membrane protein
VIPNFRDHAANERTFLAWVRTAIAVMAFGFLVAKFNIFLQIAVQPPASRDGRAVAVHASRFGDLAGLVLIAAGTVIVAVAAMRFIRTARAIDSPERHLSGARADLLLAAMMLLLGVALVVYLAVTLAGTT